MGSSVLNRRKLSPRSSSSFLQVANENLSRGSKNLKSFATRRKTISKYVFFIFSIVLLNFGSFIAFCNDSCNRFKTIGSVFIKFFSFFWCKQSGF